MAGASVRGVRAHLRGARAPGVVPAVPPGVGIRGCGGRISLDALRLSPVGGARTHDVIVVGAGPAGSTAARYAARRGLNVLILDRRKVVGVPVQCGEDVASDEEVRAIFPTVTDLDDLMAVPHRVKQHDTPVLRLWSPKGRHWDVPFRGFTVERDRMDQGIPGQGGAGGGGGR